MFNRIALFALALALPLAACGDDANTYETDDAIQSDADQIGTEIETRTDETLRDIEAETNEAAGEIEEATDGDGMNENGM